MRLSNEVIPFARALLQRRINGALKGPRDVQALATVYQPQSGFTNEEWSSVSDFIMAMKSAGNVHSAKILAKEYGFELSV